MGRPKKKAPRPLVELNGGLWAALLDLGRAFKSGFDQGRTGQAYRDFQPPSRSKAKTPQDAPEDEGEAPEADEPKPPKKAKRAPQGADPEGEAPAPKPKAKKAKKAKPKAKAAPKRKRRKFRPKVARSDAATAADEGQKSSPTEPAPEGQKSSPKKARPATVSKPGAEAKAKKAMKRRDKRRADREQVSDCEPLADNPDRLKCKSASGKIVYKDKPSNSEG